MSLEAIASAAGVVGQAYGVYETGRQNKKSREHSRYLWHKNRRAALEDWARQNSYNHPSQQMARLKQAGLSANMIYGAGAPTATGESGMIKGTQTSQPKFDVAKIDGGQIVQGYADVRMKVAQKDNIEAATIKTMMETARTKREVQEMEFIFDDKVRELHANIGGREASTKHTLGKEQREAAIHGSDMSLKEQELINKKLQAKNLKVQYNNALKDGRVKKLEAALADKGIRPSDPIYIRALVMFLKGMTLDRVLKLLK